MIKKLKQKFKIYGIDGYVIPKNDEFFSEYANPNRLKIISNFSGSAGMALIFKDKNYLYVDGRYTLQARLESGKKFEIKEIPKFNPKQILSKDKNGIKIGFDPKLFTYQSLKRQFLPKFKLIAIENFVKSDAYLSPSLGLTNIILDLNIFATFNTEYDFLYEIL